MLNMKTNLILLLLLMTAHMQSIRAQQPLKINDIHIRDPYILPDAKSGWYYLYRTAPVQNGEGKTVGGVEVFKSRDLENWSGPVHVFRVPDDNWITGTVWAPEVHAFNGKYYLFATLNSDIEWKKQQEGRPPYTFRGTQIFHANTPEGPFLPFGRTPHTPADFMALDGTLWIEDGKPYMIFCHEWIQVADGTMELLELQPDLSAPAAPPLRLFCASSASWTPAGREDYVTDGCFLYLTRTGKLLMIWSSFTDEGYAVGIAESTTGRIAGPWKHHPRPLFNRDGGHGMLFRTFDGRLCIVFHQPNGPAGSERAHIFELEDTGSDLLVKQEITRY
jgi:GH43 family beta-xylosidase